MKKFFVSLFVLLVFGCFQNVFVEFGFTKSSSAS